jgi:hypothetical protein
MARRWMPKIQQTATAANAQTLGRAAGQMAGRFVPNSKQAGDFARNSGLFVKHVVPAAVKPMHSLWHQILGFFFLIFAIGGVWRIWSHPGTLAPPQLALVVIFIVVMAAYGISSIRKSRRISRS